ncbi:MAG TPA: divalent-cation tolerance protein CutA [Alphaproteobacteria bacterium]|nr:divalent-cation tolerance protein CutA [Alphaproteobacteria bacterium]
MPFEFVYITAASPDQARIIGRTLVEERLAACANVFDNMTSFYWWEGKIDQAQEAVVVAKTRADLVPAVVARVKALHSYACPCIVALRLTQGNADFLQWIARETRPKTKRKRAARGKSQAKART